MAPEGLPKTIGDVQFRLAPPRTLLAWKKRTFEILDQTTNAAETKASLREITSSALRERFLGRLFATLHVRAVDLEAATLLAQKRLRTVLDVINFFSDVLYPPGAKAFIYLTGERESTRFTSLVFQADQFITMPNVSVGPLQPFSLASLATTRARALGVPRVLAWLAEARPDSFAKRVLSACQWAGRATTDERREEAFLLYLISLESLLLGEGVDRELSYRLKVRSAHLIGRRPSNELESSRVLEPYISFGARLFTRAVPA